MGWLAYYGMIQWSVVRFRVSIVLTLTLLALALAWWIGSRFRIRLTGTSVAVTLVGTAAITLSVPLFSYLTPASELAIRSVLAVAAVAAAVALLAGRSLLALATTLTAYAATAIATILGDPAPRIDVWLTLQQASDALGRGDNFYTLRWVGSPGVQDAFTYLPWTAVLLAPGRWLAGDVRWAQLAWTMVLTAGICLLAFPPRRANAGQAPGEGAGPADAGQTPEEVADPPDAGQGPVDSAEPADAKQSPDEGAEPADARQATGNSAGPADPQLRRSSWLGAAVLALLLLAPGTLTQIDQAWTEPLLLTGVVWWAVLLRRGHPWWAIVPLALVCASKQHLAVVLPLLLVWRPFGWRRTLATGALTAVLISPWFIASPRDFVHDTVTMLVEFPPIRFANTWYVLALNRLDVTLPFWLTGLVVIGVLAVAIAGVAQRQPPMGELLRWSALILLAANLVNKQAFYNQYWLVGALVAISLLAEDRSPQLSPSPSAATAAAARAEPVRSPRPQD